MRIVGVDFTSAPKRQKAIVVADCEANGNRLTLNRFMEFTDWPAYELWLAEETAWVGGFDFPFGLPRRFVEAQRWPSDWPGMVRACVKEGKQRFVETAMRAFRAAAEDADKHRKTDLVADSHSPLKTRTNPPVGLMFYEGAWRLLACGIRLPVMNETRSAKIALETYPGLLVKRLGERFYKNDKLTSSGINSAARQRICKQLLACSNQALSCSVVLSSRELAEPLAHESGDWLDAVLCAVQAHWGWLRRNQNFGLPLPLDPAEGWIVSA